MTIEPDKWFHDKINRNFVQLHAIEEVLYTGQTKFQFAEIMRTANFGKCLMLDGKIQSSEADEFVYHEALVQPAMLLHPHPETVFIAGGGEGATLREALAHPSVKRAVMVDIDEQVIALCKQYLPDFSRGSFTDKRTELYHVDAREYLAQSRDKFDVIIIDLPDPIEEGPAYLLFTKEFYQLARDKLSPDGVLCAQAGSASLIDLLNFTAVYNTQKSVFPLVRPYQVDMPCFGGPWGFCLASMKHDPASLSPTELDSRISRRALSLKFYDGLAHQSMFSLPKHLRETMSRQQRIITDKEPLYIYRG